MSVIRIKQKCEKRKTEEEGIREEAIEETQRSVIKNLLKENMPIEKIAKIVGLSKSKVNKIITML